MLEEPETLSPTQLVNENTNGTLDQGELPEDDDFLTDSTDDYRGSYRTSRSRGRRSAGDSQSSGRKQAAKLYPLNGDAPCEWAGYANCGGGDVPILGCLEGKQQARHHGPEKNVQNNEEGNVHRICHYCHYRWHAKNDATYDWNAGIYTPHQPIPLTPEQTQIVILDYMRYLAKGKRKKSTKEED